MYRAYNYGLEGQAAYDNFFFSKEKREERKAKREEKKAKREERAAEREERRTEKREQRDEKRELKNQLKAAEVEEKKIQSAALLAMAQDTTGNEEVEDEEKELDEEDDSKEDSGTENIVVYVALGVIAICAVGYFMLRGGRSASMVNPPGMRVNPVTSGFAA